MPKYQKNAFFSSVLVPILEVGYWLAPALRHPITAGSGSHQRLFGVLATQNTLRLNFPE